MAFALNIDISGTGKLDKSLRAFSKKARLPIEFVCADQMRLWIQDLIKFGPPRKGGKIKRKIGTARVEKDIGKVIVPMDGRIVAEWDLAATIGHGAVGHGFKTTSGAVYGVDPEYYKPGASVAEMRRQHNDHRNRLGRVDARGLRERHATVNGGVWTFVDKLHARKSVVRRYIRERQRRVGYLASAWLRALDHWAMVAKTPGKAPAFVRKVGQYGPGRYSASLDAHGNGHIESENLTGYAAAKYDRLSYSTGRKRQKDISGAMWKRMDGLIKRFNAGAV